MSVKLIYHALDSTPADVSPFDKRIIEMARDEDVSIACPYLGLNYLRRITAMSRSWRVLTDVEAWLASHNADARVHIRDFLYRNPERIHHYQDLHAKIIIAGDRALVGSANLTEKGITERAEVSVWFEREPQVDELRCWFNTLWSQTAPVAPDELETCLRSLPPEPITQVDRPHPILTSRLPRIRSRLLPIAVPNRRAIREAECGDPHLRLVERVRLAPSREWIDSYFGLVQELIDLTGLASDDQRLVMSIPKEKVLPVTINRRYVLAAFRRGEPVTGFILGADDVRLAGLEAAAYHWRFDPFSGEHTDDTPYFVRFRGHPTAVLPEELKEGWKQAVLFEVRHGRASPSRKFHEPVVYEAATNPEYRAAVLDEAFASD